jgi:hypothetical protein
MMFRWTYENSGFPKSTGDGSIFQQFVEWWKAPLPAPTADRPGIPAGPEILRPIIFPEGLDRSMVAAADEWPNWELIDVLDLD